MPLEHRRSKDIQPENTSPQPFDPTHEKKREQTLVQNENEAMYHIGSYSRTKNEAGEYARNKMTKKEIASLANYQRKSINNYRNQYKKEEYTKEEKEARKKYRYYLNEYNQNHSEIQKNQGSETKQEKSRGESFLEGLSESDKQAVIELANFCNKYGLKKTEEMFNLGHEIH